MSDMIVAPKGWNTRGSFTLIVGDLNLEPDDLGIKLILSGGFTDTWKKMHGDKFQATCDLPKNRYTPKSSAVEFPEGRRIDYILYKAGIICCSSKHFIFLAFYRPFGLHTVPD